MTGSARSLRPPLPSPLYPVRAVEWRVGAQDDFMNGVSEIRVVEKLQRDGSCLFAVTMRGWTANKDGEWEYEPIPSSRDDDYLARCRWDDWEEAAYMAQRLRLAEDRKAVGLDA